MSGSVTLTADEYQCVGVNMILDSYAVCDGVEECPLGDDEAHCCKYYSFHIGSKLELENG